jgi:hypothetical protein
MSILLKIICIRSSFILFMCCKSLFKETKFINKVKQILILFSLELIWELSGFLELLLIYIYVLHALHA